jgi:hypothetical protein
MTVEDMEMSEVSDDKVTHVQPNEETTEEQQTNPPDGEKPVQKEVPKQVRV